MKSTITFEHGENTCASKPGTFCPWMGTTRLGSVPVCILFNFETLYDQDGWIQRCEKCKQEFPFTEPKE
jgi:hypothetical protein